MSPHRLFASFCALLGAFAIAPLGRAQPLPPHLGYAYPAGGRQGTTFGLSVGGQNLKGTFDAVIAGDGVTARVTGFEQPMTPKEVNALREQLQALVKRHAEALGKPPPERFAPKGAKKDAANGTPAAPATGATGQPGKEEPASPRPVWTPEDQRTLVSLRAQLLRATRPRNPAIAETVTLEVTIAADAAVGERDLRLRTPLGVSNPLRIEVGQLPEFTKPVVTATSGPPPAPAREARRRPTPPPTAEPSVTLPVTINGQILPGGVDRYRFAARKGQSLVVAVSARALMPYLADAVPGWFQPTVSMYDAHGREVAYADSYRFNPDPVLSYRVPADGEYTLQIRDTIYRGREDFVYRMAVGELPFVTSVFPLGTRAGAPATFHLTGWNLATDELTVDNKGRPPGVFLLSVRNRSALSNPVRFAVDTLRSSREIEPNDSIAHAQSVTLPVEIDGRMDRPGDQDLFRFAGNAGEAVVAEVYARRLGSPLDSLLIITDAAGRQLAMNDDFVDKGAGLLTHQADSRVTLKLPATGSYYVRLRDVEQRGGPEYGYRLRLSAPAPDFELRVVPSALNIRPGGSVPVTVYALRRDGFEGPIALKLEDAPFGFAMAGARVPAGQDKVQFTVTAPRFGPNALAALSLAGTAIVDGQPVTHVAVPAEDMMQAFAYTHLVPASEFLVDIVGRFAPRTTVAPTGTLRMAPGGTAELTLAVALPRGLKLTAPELDGAPDGVTVKATSIRGDRAIVTIACDAAKVKAGLTGNLILDTFAERAAGKNAKGKRPPRIPLGCAPAVPFEITAPAVASE